MKGRRRLNEEAKTGEKEGKEEKRRKQKLNRKKVEF